VSRNGLSPPCCSATILLSPPCSCGTMLLAHHAHVAPPSAVLPFRCRRLRATSRSRSLPYPYSSHHVPWSPKVSYIGVGSGLQVRFSDHPIPDHPIKARSARHPSPLPCIPDWRGVERPHPKSSQIGVDFTHWGPIGVDFRGLLCVPSCPLW